MKKLNIPKFIVFVSLSMLFISSVNGQDYIIYEDFESGSKPANWTYIKYGTTAEWEYLDGGYSTTGVPGTGHPQYAKEGLMNAMFHLESFSGQRVMLVTPSLDLEGGSRIELKFWHAQDARFTYEQWRNDVLRIFYKENIDSTWKQLAEYTEKVSVWTERTIQLPTNSLSDDYYLAFEGKTNNGYGVCIDSVILVEKDSIPKYIEKVDVVQASTDFVATESKNNPILRIDITVKGNEGILRLDSLAVKSLNTDDEDITPNGVKLFASNDNIFSNSSQIGTGLSFVNGLLSFVDINRVLPSGLSSFWITYDISSDISHEKHENVLDAEIKIGSIKINSYYYPIIDESPTGSRVIYESIIFDDFETDKGWSFTGEFQRAKPLGLGGITKGSPDPDFAVSGDTIIGTDLTGIGTSIGDYENNLGSRADMATSPYKSCKYYKDIYLYFDRWFNFDTYDSATIDFNTKTANNWQKYWQSSGTSINNEWSVVKYNVSNVLNRQDSVRIRFTVGPTNSFWIYSGWNIDNVVLVGNYISKDVGVTDWIAPLSGCGHTNEEYVTVTIKNFAGDPLTDPLPLSYSFNGGTTIYRDTIQSPNLALEESITYQITKPIDLTTPGWYNNIYVTTNLPNDEDATNNQFDTVLFISPTYDVPYSQNFETNYGYYRTGGTNSSWAYGTPAGTIINSAASGTKAWVTSLSSNYNTEENSYLESPCFNFAGIDYPVIEFKSKGVSENAIDGLALHYSIDDGLNWILIPNNNDYNWNWYNETNIASLGTAGIDTTDGVWKTFRQKLPVATRNKSSVKFRFVFKSDEFSNYEGFGIDDIKLYDAPADVGVTAINYPYTKCELSDTTHLNVKIKNFGLDTLKSGSKIPVGYKVNGGVTKRDTLLLLSNLIPNAEVNFMFNSTIDMSYAGDYDFAVFTTLESNPYLYAATCNDTITQTISVTGMPRYDIGNIMGVPFPIDTFIAAGTGYANYNWAGGGNPDLALPRDTLYVDTEGWYKVTVTNGVGCTATDSVWVVPSLIDLKMEHLYTILDDSCIRENLTQLKVRVKNKGLSDFVDGVNDSIFFGYQINTNPIVYDTLFLSRNLENTAINDLDTISFTFAQKADLRAPGQYTIKMFTNFGRDLVPTDDTITRVVNTWQLPYVDLAYDSITSAQADTLILVADPGFLYSWNTTPVVTNDTLEVPNKVSRWYVVTVTDIHGCKEVKDSTYINTYDFGVTSIAAPVDACFQSTTTPITLNLYNYSDNEYIIGDTIRFAYNLDNQGWQYETYSLTSAFNANSAKTVTIVSTIDASAKGEHTLSVFTQAAFDANHANDTAHKIFNTWGLPDVELAYDTIFTSQADTVVLIANPGFATYNWSDASTNDSLIVVDNFSQEYIVTVTDIHGCGEDKDTTQIITYNFGLKSLLLPKNACSHTANESVRIVVENVSNDYFVADDKIDVGYIFNGGSPVKETITLTNYLFSGESVTYTFNQKIDMAAIGTYTLKVFVDYPLDINRENDTIYEGIRTYGFPIVEIGPDVHTHQPDTVVLTANPGYNNYTWNEGTKTNVLNVTKPESFKYIVTVTDINGCATKDSATVFTTNIAATELISPVSTCEWTDSEPVIVEVINTCSDTLLSGETIEVSYKLGSGSLVTENHILGADLLPDSTVQHTFAGTIDLTTASSYDFKVFAKSTIDVHMDDTVSVNIIESGYPVIDLGDDLYLANPVGTVITAPAGFDSYLWQDGSTNQSFTISYPASAEYKVTVTNEYGCAASDILNVYSYNIAASSLIAPVSQCELTNAEQITIGVINNSSDTLLTGETISTGYKLNGGTLVTESFNLTDSLYPDDVVEYTFTQTANMQANQLHSLKLFAELANIDVFVDDTLTTTVDVQKPDLDLGEDVYTTEEEVTLDAGAGYTSYLWYDSSTGQTLTVNVNNQTPNYYYSVTVENSFGCLATDSVLVSFDITPDLSVTELISPQSDCLSDSLYYVDVEITNIGGLDLAVSNTIIVSYKIDNGTAITENHVLGAAFLAGNTVVHRFADRIPLSTAKTYQFKTYLSYTGDVTHSNDTLDAEVTITSPSFAFSSDTLKTNSYPVVLDPGSWSSYLWQDGSTNRTFTVTSDGWYKVTVSDEGGCEATDSVYLMLNVGIDGTIKGQNFTISYYPNPVRDQLTIEIDAYRPINLEIDLLNTHGQKVANKRIKNAEQMIEKLYVGNYAKGVYYIRFIAGNEMFVRKVVIQ
ncbi:MAG: T9SS type A sorting domain-containing protein [Bacteroidales bacterium]